jgi:acetolactate synthase-1/2/3 large subunit
MGFGLPGAIGAHFADKKRQIICLNTDGAIMFNLQELEVVRNHKIPLKLFIFNNNGYGMIRISQENLFSGNLVGSTNETDLSFPNFQDVAKTFGFNYQLIDSESSFGLDFDSNISSDSPVLFEVVMDSEQRYIPRLATTKTPDGKLLSPPLEDLDPFIPIEKLQVLLHGKAHINSLKGRGLSID